MKVSLSRAVSVAASAMAMIVTSSCASLNVDKLPQPGRSYRDGYDLIVEFGSALNLTDHAKVVMDGTSVGIVTGTALAGDRVNVTTRIDRNVVVPADIHASLQQATVLGDIYVSFDRPQDSESTGGLKPNSRIPLVQTTSPPQVEDTIASMSNFIGSGSIQRMQNTVIELNRVMPRDDTARNIASRVAVDLADLSTGLATVDRWLDGLAGTGQVLHDRIPTFDDFYSDRGMRGFSRINVNAGYVGRLLPAVGTLYANGYWLAPFLQSAADMTRAMQVDKWAFESEVRPWERLLYDYFLTQDRFPAVNITSIVTPDGRELLGQVQDVLRRIGAQP